MFDAIRDMIDDFRDVEINTVTVDEIEEYVNNLEIGMFQMQLENM